MSGDWRFTVLYLVHRTGAVYARGNPPTQPALALLRLALGEQAQKHIHYFLNNLAKG
jgi:hypothetical protein